MNIKNNTGLIIYTAAPQDLSPPIKSESFCVDVVTYEDYAALEQKCLALVAENVAMKAFGETLFEMHEGLNGSGTGIQGNYEATCQQLGLEAAIDAFDEIKTPTTDAFLNEIRSSTLPENIAEIIDSGDLETICWQHEHYKAEDYRLALYRFREDRVVQSRQGEKL
ncbi:hypothetical protein UZS93_14010 [Escherichia coli]|nr:hypothetical protein [Escherichia coli]MDY8958412.1 hypothetical protein [Escherichia coli]MDY8997126.1 hypothetical protein [Escherichia coli]MDY9034225.1 hypothetical protein [Escherichia coli]